MHFTQADLTRLLDLCFGVGDTPAPFARLVLPALGLTTALPLYAAYSIDIALDPVPAWFTARHVATLGYLVMAVLPPFVYETAQRVSRRQFPFSLRSVLQLLFSAGLFTWAALSATDFVQMLVDTVAQPPVAGILTLLGFADIPFRRK